VHDSGFAPVQHCNKQACNFSFIASSGCIGYIQAMKTDITLSSITEILEKAGQDILLPAFHSSVQTSTKADGSIVTETDLNCQRFIEAELAGLDTSIALLGEEMTEEQQLHSLNCSQGSYWCLDPLDGTTNFSTALPAFAISLALIENGQVQLACIHDPVRQESFTARRGGGAHLNGRVIRCSNEDKLANAVGFIDFKRLDQETAKRIAAKRSYRSQRNIGTCALEWAWLAAGRAQFIIHGGEKIWDFAAGSLIAEEAGCQVGNFTAQALFPSQKLSSPILATCMPTLQRELQHQLID
jgi:myo-inositol-1(or 4)-monophosphatase